MTPPSSAPAQPAGAEVLHLFVAQVHRFPVKEVEEALAILDKGLKDCIHGRPGSKRQVLLLDAETLAGLGVAPGAAKENITTRGLDGKLLSPGIRLRIGEALLEVTLACDPCPRMEEIRQGLQEEFRGRRGWLCRVVEGGWIRRGAAVAVVK